MHRLIVAFFSFSISGGSIGIRHNRLTTSGSGCDSLGRLYNEAEDGGVEALQMLKSALKAAHAPAGCVRCP